MDIIVRYYIKLIRSGGVRKRVLSEGYVMPIVNSEYVIRGT